MELENYRIFRNDRNKEGGGVLLSIEKEFKTLAIEISVTKKMYERMNPGQSD